MFFFLFEAKKKSETEHKQFVGQNQTNQKTQTGYKEQPQQKQQKLQWRSGKKIV